jgi:hypothetical protein
MKRTFCLDRLLAALSCALALAGFALPAAAQGDPAENPRRYICPKADTAGAVDCFLNAVEHLYTMCRQVKSIEIIEFGYEKSDEGVNGAKSEYCVDKQKLSITRPYQAALREVTGTRQAVDRLKGLYDLWLASLTGLKWKPGESDADYKERVGQPYSVFVEHATAVRVALADAAEAKLAKAQATKSKGAATAAKAKAPAAAGGPKPTAASGTAKAAN